MTYSSGTITGQPAASSGPWTELFNGNLASRPGPTSGQFSKIVFTNPIAFAGTTCEIYGSLGSGTGAFKINDTDCTFTNSTVDWVDVTTLVPGITSITSMEFPASSSVNPPIIFAVRVDGNLLVDHSSIGVDASGNKNHFHDESLLAPDNVTSNQVYSKGTITGTPDAGFGGWENVFNGKTPSYFRANNTTSGETSLTFTNEIPFTTLEVAAYQNGSGMFLTGGNNVEVDITSQLKGPAGRPAGEKLPHHRSCITS